MAGLAGIGDRYISSMCYWMRANRSDIHGLWTSKNDTIAMDAFNVHTYFGKYFPLNGQQICVGVCPEEYGLANAMKSLVEFRDKYYPDVEVWLTEFGWDTNESYETMTSAHSFGEFSSRDLQAMWLTRAYLILSAIGVDKATMYMANDLGDDKTTYGKYGTCGVFGFEHDDNGEVIYRGSSGERAFKGDDGKYYYADGVLASGVDISMVKKQSWYYMSTLFHTLQDFTFRRELASGNDDVWVYQYSSAAADEAYALWCPTANGTEVDGYKLYVGTDINSVTLTEVDVQINPNTGDAYDGSAYGKQTTLTVDENGFVTVDVSEKPVYVVVDKK
jgi:hypothetical protein